MNTASYFMLIIVVSSTAISYGQPCPVCYKPFSDFCSEHWVDFLQCESIKDIVYFYVRDKITTRQLVISVHLALFEKIDKDDPMIDYEVDRIEHYFIARLHPTNIGLAVTHWIRDFYVAYVDRMGYDHLDYTLISESTVELSKKGLKTIVDKYMVGEYNETQFVIATHKFFFRFSPSKELVSYEADTIKNYYAPTFGHRVASVWIEDFYTAYADRMGYGKIE